MNKISGQNIEKIEPNTIYDGCAIYRDQILDKLYNIEFTHCSFRGEHTNVYKGSSNIRFESCSLNNVILGSPTVVWFHKCVIGKLMMIGNCAAISKSTIKDVELQWQSSPINLIDIANMAEMKNVTGLWLNGNFVADNWFSHIAKLEKLKVIGLSHTGTTVENLKTISNLKNLEIINLEATAINDYAMEIICGFPNLKYLSLAHTLITDREIENLLQLEKLKGLDVSATRITDRGMETIMKITGLEELDISDTNVVCNYETRMGLRIYLHKCEIIE